MTQAADNLLATPLAARRKHLATTASPATGPDYMVVLDGAFTDPGSGQTVHACLHYVADRAVLSLNAYQNYLQVLAGDAAPTLEAFALTMLDDVNNEVIPRWVQVELTTGPPDGDGRHRVIMDDCQPGWQNPDLLARHGAS